MVHCSKVDEHSLNVMHWSSWPLFYPGIPWLVSSPYLMCSSQVLFANCQPEPWQYKQVLRPIQLSFQQMMAYLNAQDHLHWIRKAAPGQIFVLDICLSISYAASTSVDGLESVQEARNIDYMSP